VRLEAVGTRVTVEHRGWEEIRQNPPTLHSFELMPFQRRQAEHWRVLLAVTRRDGAVSPPDIPFPTDH
jgi:hypothetical protein